MLLASLHRAGVAAAALCLPVAAAACLVSSHEGSAEPGAGDKADDPSTQGPRVPPIQRLLVVLVSFTDDHIVGSEAEWSAKLFGDADRTVADYYRTVSGGRFALLPAHETGGTVDDGVVAVQLTQPNPNPGRTARDVTPVYREALTLADSAVDFASFDSNGDGALSGGELPIVFVMAGPESSTTGDFSRGFFGNARAIDEPFEAPILDGVQIGRRLSCAGDRLCYGRSPFVVIGELQGVAERAHVATIAVIAHELGHALFNLPDMYNVDNNTPDATQGRFPVGGWDIMGLGVFGAAPGELSGERPVHMTAWTKQQLGFVEPRIVRPVSTPMEVRLFASDQPAYEVLELPTDNPDEYFLLEARGFAGYDQGLSQTLLGFGPGALGLEVLHVNNAKHFGGRCWLFGSCAWLMKADGLASPDGQTNLYYPGNKVELGPTTTPSTQLANGLASGISITGVTIDGDAVVATVSSTH